MRVFRMNCRVSLFLAASLPSIGESMVEAAVGANTRVLVLSDGEADDQCSLVRFLLYANEWDIEGIVTTSSQYHWHGYKWLGDDWHVKYIDAYEKVYPNLLKHDNRYPSPKYLRDRIALGNVDSEGDMKSATPGSELIVKILLDETDARPIWIQAWGGTNTLARALKTIQDEHPQQMESVAKKLRIFLIWEQDPTYQSYIKPNWGKYNIKTVISDQFIAIFYHWKKYLPVLQQKFFLATWMKPNITVNHGSLTAAYNLTTGGDFDSEGDSPSFMYAIPTGLENLEAPDWGGWGGRYVKVRDNTYLDPVLESGYKYPSGRWYASTAWGRLRLAKGIENDTALTSYLKPLWQWTEAFQNDFAARADWCVKPFAEANHPPVGPSPIPMVVNVKPGEIVKLSAKGTNDPDGDKLSYRWWQYTEAGTYGSAVEIRNPDQEEASFTVPSSAPVGQTIHIVCEIKDDGTPQLTRYLRVVATIGSSSGVVESAWGLSGLDSKPIRIDPSGRIATMEYSLSVPSVVELTVSDISGNVSGIVRRGQELAGDHAIRWNWGGVDPGVYFLRLRAGSSHRVAKLVLQ